MYLCLLLSPGTLLHVDLSNGNHRLGGSALAQCYQQLGDSVPDLDQPALLVAAFETTQQLIAGNEAWFPAIHGKFVCLFVFFVTCKENWNCITGK